MSSDAERIAFDTEIIATFDATVPLRFGSISEDDRITTEDNLWMNCVLVPGEAFAGSVGTSATYIKKRLGMYEITVWDREEKGFADILRKLDTIEDLFIGRSLNSGNTVITRAMIMPMSPYKGWNGKQITISYMTSEQVSRVS